MTLSWIAARMTGSRRSRRVSLAALAPVLAMVLAGCTPEHFPQTALHPLSEFARIGDAVQDKTLYWAIGVFVLVEGALLYAMFRFRGKPGDPEPKQVHGNTTVEIIWTIIPALILAVIAVPTVQGIFKTSEMPGDDPLTIEVVGHQWWWEFRYPEFNIVTANQIHIPVGRTVSLRQSSADVIHSFWAPRFAGKRDVFPGRETRLWFKAEAAGEYPGQCAEFCGVQHGRMSFRVMAQDSADFAKWVATMQSLGPKTPAAAAPAPADTTAAVAQAAKQIQQAQPPQPAPAPVDSLYAAGEKLFQAKGCAGCHVVQAFKPITAFAGPNLANLGARTWIAAGTLPNTPENLQKWIQHPDKVKPGVLMPNLGITDAEARALVAFLRAPH